MFEVFDKLKNVQLSILYKFLYSIEYLTNLIFLMSQMILIFS